MKIQMEEGSKIIVKTYKQIKHTSVKQKEIISNFYNN